MKKEQSEFGIGATYCLGLFLAHERDNFVWGIERLQDKKLQEIMPEKPRADLWFNVASDHLYQLEIPKQLSKRDARRLQLFCDKCINWGHGFGINGWKYGEPDLNKVKWALREAKELLLIIDKKILKVKTEKGQWE